MEELSGIKKEYCWLSPDQILIDNSTAFDAALQINEGIIESYRQNHRIKPVYIYCDSEQQEQFTCLDGRKWIPVAKELGLEKVWCCKLFLASEEEALQIRVQLQRSNHDSLPALFQMIQQLWPIYFKGQGHRTDLDEFFEELHQEEKPMNIYEKIGRQLFITGSKVKQIRKVGMVNPEYFGRIEENRYSLYAAYLQCIKEEEGVQPEPPNVKQPTYYTSQTEAPAFTSPTSTHDIASEEDHPKSEDQHHCDDNNDLNQYAKVEDGADEEPADQLPADKLVVWGTCQCCGEKTQIEINRKDLL